MNQTRNVTFTAPIDTNLRWVYQFSNGYGASVILNEVSYGHSHGAFEIAVLNKDKLCYCSPVTSDVLGWQEFHEIADVLNRIEALPEAICVCSGMPR